MVVAAVGFRFLRRLDLVGLVEVVRFEIMGLLQSLVRLVVAMVVHLDLLLFLLLCLWGQTLLPALFLGVVSLMLDSIVAVKCSLVVLSW